MRQPLLLLFAIIFFAKIYAQLPPSTNWTKYAISNVLDTGKFSSLTTVETNAVEKFKEFKYNTARWTMTDSGNAVSQKELEKPDFPVPCECRLKNDTISITTYIGFFGGWYCNGYN